MSLPGSWVQCDWVVTGWKGYVSMCSEGAYIHTHGMKDRKTVKSGTLREQCPVVHLLALAARVSLKSCFQSSGLNPAAWGPSGP